MIKNKIEILCILLLLLWIILLCSCANPRLTMGVGLSSSELGVKIGPDQEKSTGLFQWGVKGTSWQGKNKKFEIESEVDAQLFTGNESTEVGITYVTTAKYNITEKISINVGGGPAYIHDGGNFEGLDSSWLYGNIRGQININSWLIGVDHYSSPFDSDGGINLLTFGKEW